MDVVGDQAGVRSHSGRRQDVQFDRTPVSPSGIRRTNVPPCDETRGTPSPSPRAARR
ncbi:hypothetical protein AB0F91_22895 [Amycolatopsis sp. NPDC023774]|uniref:hypothetical protein n=1 Tax=Amycolatopsis sp. NPDC023774 TaxID=3155015 RepID=UPI0033D54481